MYFVVSCRFPRLP
uniref:Uncharacterized protein n=1 Tax=Lepeophtheirus salmonis TaxID=72036 RepID=A0A0K2THJ0_LEPSM